MSYMRSIAYGLEFYEYYVKYYDALVPLPSDKCRNISAIQL